MYVGTIYIRYTKLESSLRLGTNALDYITGTAAFIFSLVVHKGLIGLVYVCPRYQLNILRCDIINRDADCFRRFAPQRNTMPREQERVCRSTEFVMHICMFIRLNFFFAGISRPRKIPLESISPSTFRHPPYAGGIGKRIFLYI